MPKPKIMPPFLAYFIQVFVCEHLAEIKKNQLEYDEDDLIISQKSGPIIIIIMYGWQKECVPESNVKFKH